MSGITIFGGGGSTVADLNYTREVLNLNAGAGTTLTSGAGNNTLSSWASLFTTTSAVDRFDLDFHTAQSGSNRYQLSLSLNSDGSSPFLPDLFIQTSTSNGGYTIPILKNLPAATTIYGALRSSGTSQTIITQATGWVPQGTSNPAAATTITALSTPNTASTLPGTSVTITDTATTFTELVATTGADYKGVLIVWGYSSNPSARPGTVRLAVGASSSEVVIATRAVQITGVAGNNGRNALLALADIPSGSRLSVQVLSASAGDTVLFDAYGFG